MKKIKIGFQNDECFRWCKWVIPILEKKYNVEVTSDYDYLFTLQDYINLDLKHMLEFLEMRKDSIAICFAGEAIYPDYNIFDYAIIIQNTDLRCDDRTLYLPFLHYSSNCINQFDETRLDATKDNPISILKGKSKFCNFIYGNSNAHPKRDEIFHALSEYKKVDSLGAHLNNVPIQNTRTSSDWFYKSIELKAPYKFSIAAENAKFSGYTSEKIVSSMLANSIPIYFGNPKISEEYNTKSFINVSDFQNLTVLVDFIKTIDEDDALYCKIIAEPWRTEQQKEKYRNDVEKFYYSLYHIFEQDKILARRRPEGCWPDIMYPDFYKTDRGGVCNPHSLKTLLPNILKRVGIVLR